MKNIHVFFSVLVLFISCSNNENDTPVEPPIAIDDMATTIENTQVIIDVLNNDTLRNNAVLDSFDQSSSNNAIIREISNKLVYTPADDFIGLDTFSYTICDGLTNPNCVSATVSVTVTDTGNPVAVDDVFNVIENTTTEFSTFLDNDSLLDAATLVSIDNSSSNGEVTVINNKTISYTALNGFAGEDSFTYTICDTDTPASCATAKVTINIADEGNPIAIDDKITVVKNKKTIINRILNNDDLTDDAFIASINNSSTKGTLILENDGTLTYQSLNNFEGEDTFTYTLCDDDTPNNSCVTATVTVLVVTPISFNIPTSIANYYNDVVFFQDSSLMKRELNSLTENKHTTKLTYIQRHNFLYDADADQSNANNVILIYSSESRFEEEYQGNGNFTPQTFNTEHVYPQSFLGSNETAIADLHLLRVCDAVINTSRSNLPFIEGSGNFKRTSSTGWYPGDEWRGDVARIVFYVNTYYNEPISDVGTLSVLLRWNAEDPVSAIEEQRNRVIFGAQGNRNPFIDNPYLATLIWGGDAAENKWK